MWVLIFCNGVACGSGCELQLVGVGRAGWGGRYANLRILSEIMASANAFHFWVHVLHVSKS